MFFAPPWFVPPNEAAFPAILGRNLRERGCRHFAGRRTLGPERIAHEHRAGGFDENYFVAQVAGLTQIAGEFMQVRPLVIDLGWGELKTAIVALKDPTALAQYVDVCRTVEAGRNDQARSGLKDLAAKHATLNALVDAQLAKLA